MFRMVDIPPRRIHRLVSERGIPFTWTGRMLEGTVFARPMLIAPTRSQKRRE